jgi:hypothetical protein
MQITINVLLNQFIVTENGERTILSLDEVANYFKRKC